MIQGESNHSISRCGNERRCQCEELLQIDTISWDPITRSIHRPDNLNHLLVGYKLDSFYDISHVYEPADKSVFK